MCPLCTSFIVLAVAGAVCGAADKLVARTFARVAGPWKTPPESEEGIRHD